MRYKDLIDEHVDNDEFDFNPIALKLSLNQVLGTYTCGFNVKR